MVECTTTKVMIITFPNVLLSLMIQKQLSNSGTHISQLAGLPKIGL